MVRFISFGLFILLIGAVPARAQSFEAGAHFASAQWSEFDGNDSGIGGRLTWRPSPLIGVDADITWYWSNYPEQIGFSRDRIEGLFGINVGPRIDRVRPFAKVTGGFLHVSPTSGAFACIAIFPPPLACLLAGGTTLPAFEIGGGIAVDATSKTFIRFDVAQRFLQYPGPTFRDGLADRVDEDFFGGAIRLTIGAGVKF